MVPPTSHDKQTCFNVDFDKFFQSLKTCKFIKKRLQHRCFPENIANFSKTTLFKEHLCGCFFIRSQICVLS